MDAYTHLGPEDADGEMARLEAVEVARRAREEIICYKVFNTRRTKKCYWENSMQY